MAVAVGQLVAAFPHLAHDVKLIVDYLELPNGRNHGEKFTQARFDALPGLVSQQVFCAWTGLDPKAVRELIDDGKLEAAVSTERRRRFAKAEIARLTRFRL